MRKAIGMFVLCWLSAAGLQAGFVPVSLSSIANSTFTTIPIPGQIGLLNAPLLPTGPQTYGGVPFTIGPVWAADVAANEQVNQGQESVVIPINVFGISSVETLMSTEWGETQGPFVTLTFTFSDTSTYTVGLVGGVGIRDYNNYLWTNTISSTWSAPGNLTDSTVNVWTDDGLSCAPQPGSGPGPITCNVQNGNYQRLDMQTINLPTSAQNLTLVSMTLVDTGNHAQGNSSIPAQRSFITGLSVDQTNTTLPEPGTWALLLGGLGAMAALRKRRAG